MTIDYTARRVGKALLQRVVPRSDFTFPLGFRGRLGNQLFQIAGTYSLARRHGAGIALRSDWPYRPYFDLPQSWFHSRLTTLRCRQAWPLAEEIPAEWRIYLQDLRVWDGRDEDIRMLLSLSQSAHDAAEAAEQRVHMPPNRTAVHVRRGDYLDPHVHANLGLVPAEFYEQAMAEVRSRDAATTFVVFSDDVSWCRRHLTLDDAVIVENNPDWLDFALMARCGHHICGNSTFSWWAAFLSGDPMPIVPLLRGVRLDTIRRICPDHWLRIELPTEELPAQR